jgi:subtilisin family serine protease
VVTLLLALTSCSRAPLTAPGSGTAAGSDARLATPATVTTSDDVVVTLAPGTNPQQIANDYGSLLVQVIEGVTVLRPTDVTQEVLLSRLSLDPRVVTVEPNATLMMAESRQRAFSFDDGLGTLETYLEQAAASSIDLNTAHYASRGEGVPVAILDAGADTGHPMLAGAFAGGWDFVDNDPNPADLQTGSDTNDDGVPDGAFGHGTHVAGIVALTAPRARLLIVRVLDSDGIGRVSDVAAGIHWAVDHGARVINMSLGMLRSSPAIRTALDNARARGIVCVASAGNWGSEAPVEFPASSPNVLSVAAVDGSWQPADFTSYGAQVALCAPGVGVRSAFPGGGYRIWSGTSMSAGFVSGVAALLLAHHPDWGSDEVRARMAQFARPVQPAVAAQQGKLGAGVINASSVFGPDLPAADPDGAGQSPMNGR